MKSFVLWQKTILRSFRQQLTIYFKESSRGFLEDGADHLDFPLLSDNCNCNNGELDGVVDHLGAPHHVERPQLLPSQPHHRRPPHGCPQLCAKVEHSFPSSSPLPFKLLINLQFPLHEGSCLAFWSGILLCQQFHLIPHRVRKVGIMIRKFEVLLELLIDVCPCTCGATYMCMMLVCTDDAVLQGRTNVQSDMRNSTMDALCHDNACGDLSNTRWYESRALGQ